MVECEQEAESVERTNAALEARNSSSKGLDKDQGKQEQWAAISAIHKEKSQECKQMNSESLTDIPATSTPKKVTKGHIQSSETTEILTGHFEGSGYHRDGTRIGWY